MALDRGETAQVGGNLLSQQPAMLVTALIGLTFDVQHNPAFLGKAIGRPITLHGGWIGTIIFRGRAIGANRCRQDRQRKPEEQAKRLSHGRPQKKSATTSEEIATNFTIPKQKGQRSERLIP